jgi:hypothetical protein
MWDFCQGEKTKQLGVQSAGGTKELEPNQMDKKKQKER